MNKRLDALFSAVTFAEAGEFATAQEFVEPRRHVLLALNEEQCTARALNCAANLCQRVEAGLDLLLVSGEPKPADVPAPLAELEAKGIPYRVLRRTGKLGAEVLRHVREHRDVLFVVIDTLASWGAHRSERPWERLACPLVIANEGCAKNS
jgi:hypothetical protein